MTTKQEDMLLHMTGLDRSKEQYRNHYAVYPGGDAYADIQAMVAEGILGPGRTNKGVYGDMEFYYATEAGIAKAWELKKARKPKRKAKV